jgi:hypothetical protein
MEDGASMQSVATKGDRIFASMAEGSKCTKVHQQRWMGRYSKAYLDF